MLVKKLDKNIYSNIGKFSIRGAFFQMFFFIHILLVVNRKVSNFYFNIKGVLVCNIEPRFLLNFKEFELLHFLSTKTSYCLHFKFFEFDEKKNKSF